MDIIASFLLRSLGVVSKSIGVVRCGGRLVHGILISTGCHDAAVEIARSMEQKRAYCAVDKLLSHIQRL